MSVLAVVDVNGSKGSGLELESLGAYSPRPVRRMGWDLFVPLGRRSGRVVIFRKVNMNVSEDRMKLLQCPKEAYISCFTCDILLQ